MEVPLRVHQDLISELRFTSGLGLVRFRRIGFRAIAGLP